MYNWVTYTDTPLIITFLFVGCARVSESEWQGFCFYMVILSHCNLRSYQGIQEFVENFPFGLNYCCPLNRKLNTCLVSHPSSNLWSVANNLIYFLGFHIRIPSWCISKLDVEIQCAEIHCLVSLLNTRIGILCCNFT